MVLKRWNLSFVVIVAALLGWSANAQATTYIETVSSDISTIGSVTINFPQIDVRGLLSISGGLINSTNGGYLSFYANFPAGEVGEFYATPVTPGVFDLSSISNLPFPGSATINGIMLSFQNESDPPGILFIPAGTTFTFGTDVAAPEVPEPGTWVMMILGMGAAGYSLRKRRHGSVARAC